MPAPLPPRSLLSAAQDFSLFAGLVGGGLGGKVLPMLIPALGGLVGGGDNLAGTGGLSAIVGALLPLIVSFLKKPAVAA